MLSVVASGFRSSHIMKKVRVTNTAVNSDARMPTISVTAKPFTGPVPNWKRQSAVSTVERLESVMAGSAWRKPSSMARRTVLPWRSSSRMRSKISTLASTAMPIESTRPARPGSVSVASSIASAPAVRTA